MDSEFECSVFEPLLYSYGRSMGYVLCTRPTACARSFQMIVDEPDTTTLKPVVPSVLKFEKSDVWAESDVTSCHVGKTCVFRCRIFVSGFHASLSQVN